MSEGKKEILLGDCLELMKDIPDGSIDLTVTSPPYDNLRTYNDSLEWGEHIWKEVIKQLFRVTKEGGVVVWIVADATIKGSETGTSFKQALYFKEIGFNLHDTMIWNKPTFTAVGALVNRYAQVFEYMFVFSKGSLKTFNPIKDRENKRHGDTKHGTIRQKDGTTKKQSSLGKKIAKYGQRFNVWNMSTVQSNIERRHPAQFPLILAKDHILSWSNEGDVILDPFAGSGTTAIACLKTKRQFIVMEKEQKYYDIILKRVGDFNKKFETETLFGNEM